MSRQNSTFSEQSPRQRDAKNAITGFSFGAGLGVAWMFIGRRSAWPEECALSHALVRRYGAAAESRAIAPRLSSAINGIASPVLDVMPAGALHQAMTTLTVWYDGDCPLCRREISLMRRLDRRGAIDFVDAATGTGGCPIDRRDLLARFHALEDGKMLSGAEAFAAMWRAIPVAAPAWTARP